MVCDKRAHIQFFGMFHTLAHHIEQPFGDKADQRLAITVAQQNDSMAEELEIAARRPLQCVSIVGR